MIPRGPFQPLLSCDSVKMAFGLLASLVNHGALELDLGASGSWPLVLCRVGQRLLQGRYKKV